MYTCCVKALLVLCLSVSAFGQFVTVTDTLWLPNGSKYSGQLTISWPVPFTGGDGHQIPSGPPISVSVNNGALSVPLEANSTATPANTYYSVVYRPAGSAAITEIWIVPCCSSPVGLSSVRVAQPPSPSFLISLSQIAQGGATSGQCLTWNGSTWTPAPCATLPNIVTPGTYTTVTVNAEGLVTAGLPNLTLAATPLTTNQDILYNNSGVLSNLGISTVSNGSCLGNSGGVWSSMSCSGGSGSGTVINDVPLTSPGLVVANGTVHVTLGNLSGDATTSGLALTLATVNAGSGTCGDATHVCQVSTNAKGLVTGQAAVAISNTFPSGTQTQYLNVQPNTGNNTTFRWSSLFIANVNDYNYPAITPTGSPSLSVGSNTVTIPLAPLGLNASDTAHYVYISGGTGTAEPVSLTGGTCTELATACTLTFVASHTHSGAYTLTSASGGLAEAIVHTSTGTTIWVPAGTYAIYAPVYAPHAVSLRGDGMRVSILQSQNAATGILDLSGIGFNGSVIEDLAFNNSGAAPGTQGTSGNYGIRLGNGGGNEASWVRINRCYFEPLYDAILSVNGSHYNVTNSVFYNFSHTGITVNDTTNNDNDALIAYGNDFFNYLLSTPAEACILITSTSAIHITDNNCQGSTALTQINNGFELSSTLGSQVTITGNTINTYKLHGILMAGVYNLITITGNQIALPSSANVAAGIQINGNNATNVCTGICEMAITGNTLQGPGSGTTGATAIYLQNFIGNTTIGPNTLNLWNVGINTSEVLGSGTQTILPHNMENVSTKIALAAGTGALFDHTATVTFSTLPSSCANGSVLFCSDCNSTCTAGSSNGRTCFRENSAWLH